MAKRTKPKKFPVQTLQFFLGDKVMKDAETYARRGRRFQGLSEGQLREKLATALAKWAETLDPDARIDFDDAQSEFSLRGLPFPTGDDIHAAVEKLVAKTSAAMEELRKDPERLREANEELTEEIAAALAEVESKKGN